jgi:hypothetical protein
MRTFATFLMALVLSTAVALLFNLVVLYTIHEFSLIPPMLGWTIAVAIISVLALGIGFGLAKQERTLNWIAMVLAATAIVPLGLIPASMTGMLAAVGRAEAKEWFLRIAFTFLVPPSLTILIQWWLIRRRWRHAHLQQL